MSRVKIYHSPRDITYRFVGGDARTAVLSASSTSIAEATGDAIARIDGVAREDEPLLIAPLSGVKCIAYSSTLELIPILPGVLPQLRQRVHFHECRSAGFTVVDNSGSARVAGAWVEISARIEYARIVPYEGVDPRQRSFMLKKPGWKKWWTYGCCFYEAVLMPAMTLAVLGIAQRTTVDQVDDAAFRRAPVRVDIRGTESHPTRIAMIPQGGDQYLEQKTL